MTDHTHSVHVEGCYRCALSRDEVTGGQRVNESVLAGLEWHLSEFPADDFDGHRLTTADLVADLRAAREENQRLQERLAELERHATQARADAGLNAAARDLLQRRVDAALTLCGTGLGALLLGRPRKKRVSVELVTRALLGDGSRD